MKLGWKTHCALFLTVLAILALVFALSRSILLKSFLELEEQQVKRNVHRGVDALANDIAILNRETGDWAAWDDACQFIAHPSREFIKKNVPDKTLGELKLNLVLFLDADGRLVYGKSYDAGMKTAGAVPDGLRPYLSPKSPLLHHHGPESTAGGIISLPEGLMLIASRPILTSDRKGPVRGSLMMGRYLDLAHVEQLSGLIHLKLKLEKTDSPQLATDFREAMSSIGKADVIVRVISDDLISGYTLLRDIYGKPAIIMRVESPRDIYRRGVQAIWYFAGCFFTITGLFVVAVQILINRLIVSMRRGKEHEARYHSLVDRASEGILLIDCETREIMESNAAFQALTGMLTDNRRNLTIYDIIPEPRDKVDFLLQRLLREKRELQFLNAEGGVVDTEASASLITSEGREFYSLVIHDITERKRFEAQLMRQASYDTLTGLPNRTLLIDRLHQALEYEKRSGHAMAVMLLELDNFKIINDTLGHQAGDYLLQLVAQILRDNVRSADTVARFGGDEFVILLLNVATAKNLVAIAHKLLGALSRPFTLEGRELFITASIGIAMFPADGDDVETLLKNADTAMYHVKERGKNGFQFFAEEMNRKVKDRLDMESSLRRAIERNEFVLHYQPRVDLTNGQISGFEALIRWQRADGALIPPDSFIPLAEETGMIIPIGEWVLRTACCRNRQWQEAGLPHLPVSVNISPRQFLQEDFVAMVGRVLEETGLQAGHLELEVTETVFMQDPAEMVNKLKAIKGMGVRIAIDDFGTGYSSLSYLKRFPIDTLKIDKSFVSDIASNYDDAAIVMTIIAMAHALKFKVVAEGVETMEQLAFLIEHQCEEMQGYYFSRPITAEALESLLRSCRQLEVKYDKIICKQCSGSTEAKSGRAAANDE